MSSKIPIHTIYIRPRNNFYCSYIINDSEIHTKKYEDLTEYLISLIPEKIIEISRLMELHKHFIVFVQEKEIKELLYDYDSEIDAMKKNLTSSMLKDAQNEMLKPKNTMDTKIKEFSQKIINKKDNFFMEKFRKSY